MNKLFASVAGLAIIFSAATVSFADEGKGKPADAGKPVPADAKEKGKPADAGKSAESKGAEKKADAAPSQGGDTSGGGKAGNDMTGKSSGPAGNSPSGNNGTVKFHRGGEIDHGSQAANHEPRKGGKTGDLELRRNMPHLGCTLHLYAYHFDANSTFNWEILNWPGTGKGRELAYNFAMYKADYGDPTTRMSAQGDWVSMTFSRDDFINQDAQADKRHGGHFKLNFWGDDNKHAKQKVVWIEGCDDTQGGGTTTPPATGGQQYDCIAGNGIPNQQSGRDDAAGCESTGGQQYDCIAGNGIPNQRSGRDDAAGCETSTTTPVVGGVENAPVFTEVIVERINTVAVIESGAVIDAGVVLGVQNADAALVLASLTNLPSTSTDAGSARGLFALAGLIFTLGGAQLLRRTAKTI